MAGLKVAHPSTDSALTFPVAVYGVAPAGGTYPESGALGAPLLGFDKASTETVVLPFGSLVPDTWQTFQVWFEALNVTGGAGDVFWRLNDLAGGGDVDTTVSYAAPATRYYNRISPSTTYTFATIGPFAGISKKGGALSISRVGGNGADTLDGDIHLAAVLLVRVT